MMKKIILRVMMMALFAINSLFTASAQTPKSSVTQPQLPLKRV